MIKLLPKESLKSCKEGFVIVYSNYWKRSQSGENTG